MATGEQPKSSGGCHCGRVAYEVDGRPESVSQCNCSICTKKAYLHWMVTREQFHLLTAWDDLAVYSFNTHTAKHYFCRTCGVASFYIARSDPDKIDVNARCLEGFDPSAVALTQFDGRNWEAAFESYERDRRKADKVSSTDENTPRVIAAVKGSENPVATLGFGPADFEVFKVPGFNERMAQIYARVRPRLINLGDELAPELGRKLHLEFFPHVAKHARRTVNPPPETWTAFGPSERGYKRYGYLALCVSAAGVHARAVVKSDADHRPEMARGLERQAAQLEKSFKGTKIARYENWDFEHIPAGAPADAELFASMAEALAKKSGWVDVGFGWNVQDSIRLERAELIEAFCELEPLYRVFRAVV